MAGIAESFRGIDRHPAPWDVPIYSPSKSLLDKWEAVVVDDAAYRIRSYFR